MEEQNTLHISNSSLSESHPTGATFVLSGNVYHEVRTLSQSSGEAQVVLVERDGKRWVLKLYYPGYVPEEGVLQVVWNMDFEMIVRLHDYGRTIVGGISREYELMEYLEGISLADYSLKNEEKQFRKIALQAAAALAYCHNCNLIHKDVKLGNFIFRDKEARELVLTDFGISTLMSDEEQMHKTTQARTPLYAAPEMYDNVIDGEVELTPKADFYSLGILLFFLWLGRNPFSGNERSMMRLKGEGKLPNLDQLPEDVRKLIRGLTVVNPEKRWGYAQVERWFKGEDVDIDEASIYLRYKSFVVDSEKNVLASNARELAQLLAERKHLGIKYLYGKLISGWLEECGNQKMAVELNDIVDKRYPLNPEAGFQAALYTLDDKLPYTDAKGHIANNVHEVVMLMLSFAEDYKVLLQDENHPLYVYLEMTTELEVSRLKEFFKTDNPTVAFWRMIFELDSSIPFLSDKPSNTIEEIISAFANGTPREDEWRSLTDGRLLSWLYYKDDPLLYVELKEIYDKHLPYTRSEAYRVLYHLKRDIGFDLKEACSREQVAGIMSELLTKLQSIDNSSFAREIEEYIGKNSRLYYYAEIKGWHDVTALNQHTFDLQASEHISRYGTYDIRIAAYRFCMAMGKNPEYYLRSTGQLISSLEEYNHLSDKVKYEEMKNGCMKEWLTIFFHENPFEAFEEKYSYEKALETYLLEIGQSDPEDFYFKRFKFARDEVGKMVNNSRMHSTSIQIREKIQFYTLIGMTLLLCSLLILFGYSNPKVMLDSAMFGIAIPVGLFSMLSLGVWSYFHGNGVLPTLALSFLGCASGLLPVFILRAIGPENPTWLVIASLGMILITATLSHHNIKSKSMYQYGELKHLFHENISTTLLDPLYYAYRQKSNIFKGSTYRSIEEALSIMNATKYEFMINFILYITLIGTLILLFISFHSELLDLNIPDLWKVRMGIIDFINQIKTTEL